MGRLSWTGLPPALRSKIASQIGYAVTRIVEHREGGSAGDFAGTLITDGGTVFVKASKQENHPGIHALALELRTNRYLPAMAPRVLWKAESQDWIAVGYEAVTGRHANFAPTSQDLPHVLGVLVETAAHHAEHLAQFESLAARWGRISPWRTLTTTNPRVMTQWERGRARDFVDRELYVFDLLSGATSVAHTDMHERNVLIGQRGARLVSWAWACRAPAWVDPAILAVRLIEAGHTPQQAEGWVAQVPAWKAASPDALDAFAVALLGLWMLNSRYPALTAAARQYVEYRLDVVAHRPARHC